MNGTRVFEVDVQIVAVRPGFVKERFRPSLNDYIGALYVLRAWRTEKSVSGEQSVFDGPKFGAQKELLTSAVLI